MPKTPSDYDVSALNVVTTFFWATDDKQQKETSERDRNQANVPNPYEILLSTSGGQYVEVSNLASYLGEA